MSEEIEVKHYDIALCDLCYAGKGGECHTPGCALWCKSAPDVPLRGCVSAETVEQLQRELAVQRDTVRELSRAAAEIELELGIAKEQKAMLIEREDQLRFELEAARARIEVIDQADKANIVLLQSYQEEKREMEEAHAEELSQLRSCLRDTEQGHDMLVAELKRELEAARAERDRLVSQLRSEIEERKRLEYALARAHE